LDRLKKPPALPFAALHHLLWDYGIVLALQRDTAAAPGRGRSFTAALSLAAGLWRRRFQHCLYLVGPPEDSLRLRLRLSLVPGRTRPCSEGGHRLHCPALGRCLNGGIVVVATVHLEWGSSSSSNTCPFWAKPNKLYFYITKRCAWVWRGLGRCNFGSC
jgi:hypothetical protein